MDSGLSQSSLDQDLSEAVSLILDARLTIFINSREYTEFRDDPAFALAINFFNPAEYSRHSAGSRNVRAAGKLRLARAAGACSCRIYLE